MVAVEGPGEIPGHGGREAETERAKPALPGARPEPKPPTSEAVGEAARVITKDFFDACCDRPGCYEVRAPAAIAAAEILLARVPACDGACGSASGIGSRHAPAEQRVPQAAIGRGGAGTAPPVKPDILIHRPPLAYPRCPASEVEGVQALGRRQSAASEVGVVIGEHYDAIVCTCRRRNALRRGRWSVSGQLSPVVVCRRQERYELIDGFNALRFLARGLAQMLHSSAWPMEADERTAKALSMG